MISKDNSALALIGLLIVLSGSVYFDYHWELVWSALGVLFLAFGVYKRDWMAAIMYAAAIIAPVSIKYALPFADLYLPIEFLSAAIAIAVVFQFVLTNQFLLVKKFPFPILWLLSFLPGVIYSEMPLVSIKFWALNGLFVLAFYYGFILLAQRNVGFPFVPFLISLLPVTAAGILHFIQYDFNPITISGIFKPFFYSHTMFGAVMAFLTGIALGNLRANRWWGVVLFFGVALTIFSGSRAALWSLVFMVLLYILIQMKPLYRLILPLIATVMFLSFGGATKLEDQFSYNNYESHDPQATLVEKSMSVTNLNTDVSNIERLNRWVSALRMFEERPFTGFGPGTYQFTYLPFQEKRHANRLTVTNPDSPPPGSGGTAHSELLLQLGENGIWTPLLFLFLWLRWIFLGFFIANKQSIHIPLLLGLSTYLFHMQFNNFLNQSVFAFLFWGTAAYLDVQLSRNKDELLR